jgi:catechol 2,3-dioxygenase-like lactoylglutathione lyase family enzyme
MRFHVEGLDHVAVAVGDQARSEAFYRDVLGLRREHAEAWGDMPVAVMRGGSGMALFPQGDGDPGFRHVAFRVDGPNFTLAQQELREAGIDFEFADHDVSQSIYFTDPDGLRLELTTYDVRPS